MRDSAPSHSTVAVKTAFRLGTRSLAGAMQIVITSTVQADVGTVEIVCGVLCLMPGMGFAETVGMQAA